MPGSDQPYYVRTEGNGVMLVFRAGVRIRLIASQDHTTGKWKVRLPWGVSVDPKIWRKLAPRAVWCFVKNQEQAHESMVDTRANCDDEVG